jgi:DNA polymerase III subunit gamma/tau
MPDSCNPEPTQHYINMSYTVFALKWRPKNFEEVIGQNHIITTLTNSIQKNRLAHAYLFSGPRGVGKTSCARILAKAMNCQEGPTANPCGKCPSCIDIAASRSLDVMEIDGASNRGIDEIRSLRENVKFSPTQGKYKVYIIDEVHQITSEGFNALLKTLEEPPAFVKFIFATTHPQKVPLTILSLSLKRSTWIRKF